MSGTTTETSGCAKHLMTRADFVCVECGAPFCADCVVFPTGKIDAPICITCGLIKGGVRHTDAGHPAKGRRPPNGT